MLSEALLVPRTSEPEGKHLLVIGELNVDLIVTGLEAFPAPGREVMAGALRTALGGSSAICAAGLARLGAAVEFVGKLGLDGFGDLMAGELQRLGVGTRHLIRDGEAPTGVTISLVHAEDRALVTALGSISRLRLADIDRSILPNFRHLHVGSYFLQHGLRPDLPELFSLAHRAGLTVSLDTGWDPDEQWGGQELLGLLSQVDVFFPNESEARAIAGLDDLEQAVRALAGRARLVVVKQGPAGAMALQDGQIIRSPGLRVDAVDTTGAGDSFDAGFLFAHVVRGESLAGALRFANVCGALSTTGYGGTAAQPTLAQVLDVL